MSKLIPLVLCVGVLLGVGTFAAEYYTCQEKGCLVR